MVVHLEIITSNESCWILTRYEEDSAIFEYYLVLAKRHRKYVESIFALLFYLVGRRQVERMIIYIIIYLFID